MRLVIAKTILRRLRHLSCQQGEGLIFSKTVLGGGILAATHKLGQLMTKVSNKYSHTYAPTPTATIWCTVRRWK